MLPSTSFLHERLGMVIDDNKEQGHVVTGMASELAALPDSYDALAAFAHRLANLPLRPDWPYVEPSDLDSIWAECDPARPRGRLPPSTWKTAPSPSKRHSSALSAAAFSANRSRSTPLLM